jgi:hypothetical protein
VERVVSCSAKQSERGGWLWHTQNLGWITHATTPTLPYPTLPSIFHPLADREGFTDCIPPPPWFGLATPAPVLTSTSPGFLLFPPPHPHVDGRYSTYQQLLGVVESQVDSIRSNAPHPFSVVTPPNRQRIRRKGGKRREMALLHRSAARGVSCRPTVRRCGIPLLLGVRCRQLNCTFPQGRFNFSL